MNSIGLEFDRFPAVNGASLDQLYENATGKGNFGFVVLPLRRFGDAPVDAQTSAGPAPLLDADSLTLPDATYNAFVVAKTSEWRPATSDHDRIRRDQILQREWSWVAHIGLGAAMVSVADFAQPLQFAHHLSRALAQLSHTQIWVRIPVSSGQNGSITDGWEFWNAVRTACDFSAQLHCVLELDSDCPSAENWRRWRGESVAAISCPSKVWFRNKSGYPVLGKAHQALVRTLAKYFPGIRLIYRGEDALSHQSGTDAYSRYLQHLYATKDPQNVIDEHSQGFEDRLQIPLQPLFHNLESMTYQVFLLDPAKYQLYEDAIFAALSDRIALDSQLGIQSADRDSWQCVIMVVGAGSHGPLVDCVLRACIRASCSEKVKLYALEKNPNALVTLRKQPSTNELWLNHKGPDGAGVQVVHGDMRHSTIAEKADILVSELLGSFGDNELSPECLDGAQKLLKETDAFNRSVASIPAAYTAFLAPIASTKLVQNVRGLQHSPSDSTVYDTPYVVKFHQTNDQLVSAPQATWTFEHPSANICPENSHNIREAHLQFAKFETDGMLTSVHGFAGYFECVLYQPLPDADGVSKEPVLMSINPPTHTPNMFSWFPMFFPLEENIIVGADDVLEVFMQRCCNSQERKIWYEWSTSLRSKSSTAMRVQTRIHNKNGSVYSIGL